MSVLHEEINQQPAAIRDFLKRETANVSRVGEVLRDRSFDFIFIAARGTSDNAARYGQYLFGAHNRLPVALAAPSLFTVYGTPPRLERALVIGISQSGQSPDVVSVVDEARCQGASTVAITNDPASPMAEAAEFHINLGVGAERSVAATKTYTAELTALALLSSHMAGDLEHHRLLERVPGWMEGALQAEAQAEQAARVLAADDRALVIGRGFNYATAFETALKIKELSYVEAEPYSSADFKHGPIAMAENGLPVLLISCGPAFRDELAALQAELSERGVRLVVVGDTPAGAQPSGAQLAGALTPAVNIPLPADMPEWLTPLVAVLPGQLLAFHLSRARGFDPDLPRTIRKVTMTY